MYWDDDCYSSSGLYSTETTITVPRKYHRHIIGKEGSTIRRIRNETGASIDIPPKGEETDEIVIEGTHSEVAQAKREIMTIVEKFSVSPYYSPDRNKYGG